MATNFEWTSTRVLLRTSLKNKMKLNTKLPERTSILWLNKDFAQGLYIYLFHYFI